MANSFSRESSYFSDDVVNIDDPAFMANPSNSFVGNNIIFDKCASIGEIDDAVSDYSTVSNNKLYYLFQLNNAFKNYKEGDYSIDEKSPIYYKNLNDMLKKVGRC